MLMNYRRTGLIVFAGLYVATLAQAVSPPWEIHLSDAFRLRTAGEYTQAEESSIAALKYAQISDAGTAALARCNNMLGVLRYDQGRYDEAVTLLQESIQLWIEGQAPLAIDLAVGSGPADRPASAARGF